MVVEMKSIGFDMGDDNCGLTKATHCVLLQGGEQVKGHKGKLFSMGTRGHAHIRTKDKLLCSLHEFGGNGEMVDVERF